MVVGYLAVLMTQAAGRFVNDRIDDGLKSLYDRVVRRLGGGAVQDLQADPADEAARGRVARAVENVAAVDRGFADEIAAIVARLDQAGGRRLVNQVRARTNVQHFGSGDQATHGGVINKSWSRSTEHPGNYSGAPAWVKVATALGALCALGGLVLLVFDVATAMSAGRDEVGRPLPPDLDVLTRGAVLFVVGLALCLLGSLGRSMSKRGW
ncbi:hypothetical protein GCM10010185_39590 [Saccharothrix coeruleofusca]|uniref:Uncharacterized protein n=1 Tax=Saccharothrix coeruleofusca TaxID=33919 RepID=A0A918AQL4_9PSEU|nr:hypothetical protein GCM10010185_39590 [Saccharothrix coeruleofusca]